jgi:hypothetical protein
VPGASSIVIKTWSWDVPMSLSDTAAWFQAHPPSGVTMSGTMSGSDNGVRSQGFTYFAKRGVEEGQSQLEIGIVAARAGHASIRADGIVVWLDPTPIKDNFRGARVRLTVAQGCPQTLPADVEDVTNDRHQADLKSRLVPNEKPAGSLECDYFQSFGAQAVLSTQKRLDATEATAVALSLFERDPSHPDGEISSCGAGIGEQQLEVLVFSYSDRADVDIWSSGGAGICGGTSNGVINVPGHITPSQQPS